MSDGKPYRVGYGQPPEHSRWQKGQSGNPSGRPKTTRSLKAIMAKQLDEKVVVKQGGEIKKLSAREILVKSWMTHATKGNAAISKVVLTLMQRHGLDIDPPEPDPEMDDRDREALYLVLRRWYENRKRGLSFGFTEEEIADVLYEADSRLVQMEFDLQPAEPDRAPPTVDEVPSSWDVWQSVDEAGDDVDDSCLF